MPIMHWVVELPNQLRSKKNTTLTITLTSTHKHLVSCR